jgi:short subunit dehydrogenase-like uncharacterized protein
MESTEQLAIVVVIALVALAGLWTFLTGPASPMAAGWRDQARELEVKIRLGHGMDVVPDLLALSQLQSRLGKRWDAEQSLQRALKICQHEVGELSPQTIAVMEDYAALMAKMNRRAEAKSMRKRIKDQVDKSSK